MPKKNPENKSTKTSLEEKCRKAAGDTVVDAILGDDADALQNRLTSLAKHENETEEKRDTSPDIQNLKEDLKNLTGPFRDTLKSISLQRKLIATRLEEMGQ